MNNKTQVEKLKLIYNDIMHLASLVGDESIIKDMQMNIFKLLPGFVRDFDAKYKAAEELEAELSQYLREEEELQAEADWEQQQRDYEAWERENDREVPLYPHNEE